MDPPPCPPAFQLYGIGTLDRTDFPSSEDLHPKAGHRRKQMTAARRPDLWWGSSECTCNPKKQSSNSPAALRNGSKQINKHGRLPAWPRSKPKDSLLSPNGWPSTSAGPNRSLLEALISSGGNQLLHITSSHTHAHTHHFTLSMPLKSFFICGGSNLERRVLPDGKEVYLACKTSKEGSHKLLITEQILRVTQIWALNLL